MFIEFETGSGRTLLNVRHIVQVKRFQDLSDAITEIILANGGRRVVLERRHRRDQRVGDGLPG